MIWSEFIYFAVISLFFWVSAVAAIYLSKKKTLPNIMFLTGVFVFSLFIARLWLTNGHPPLRTMGETRLWYSLFIVVIGYITWLRWNYKWLMGYSTLVSAVFIIINLLKPEIHSAGLMPALQSPWFVPHVTVYILSYAMMGAATIASIIFIAGNGEKHKDLIGLVDNLVRIGLGFLLMGMLMGALWAKEAWGDYWTWDPKEVWAFITAATYLVYIHLRRITINLKLLMWIIPVAFLLLMIAWLGVSYLPSAVNSIHTY
ncbi:MAG: cytochrome c biogenesis protein CcsA [Bacteroidales bacterium]|nr:cytochrome c biogenesis protein CcsA [Bacteroidales bacterium]